MDILTVVQIIAASGVVGLGDQYLSLLLVAVATKLGWISMAPPVGFIGEPWFIAVVFVAWLLTVPPSAVPSAVAPYFATMVNLVSGPVSLLSGAVFALASAGFITAVHPDFQIGMYLLSHDASWLSLTSYRADDWAVLFGGAAVGGGLTLMRFASKPGISLLTGTTHTLSAPMFAIAENVLAIVLVPVVLLLQRVDPVFVVVLMVLLTVGLLVLAVVAFRKLVEAGQGLGKLFALMEEDPYRGLAIAAEAAVWGLGWLLLGQWARAVVMLGVWGGVIFLAASGFGLCLALPAYILIAPRTAVALFHHVRRTRTPNLARLPDP